MLAVSEQTVFSQPSFALYFHFCPLPERGSAENIEGILVVVRLFW